MEEMNWSAETISLEDLDNAIKDMVAFEAGMEEVKAIYKDALEKYETQRSAVLSMLQAAGKTSYKVDGVGTVSQALKYSVTTPKDFEAKKAMIDYFNSMGEAAYGFLTVNHMTLNAYINDMSAQDPSFKLPGVGERKETAELRVRKERSKE